MGSNHKNSVKTIYYNEAGPLATFIKGHIDIRLARATLFSHSEVQEYANRLEKKDRDRIGVRHFYISPMDTMMDDGEDISLDENGEKFVEITFTQKDGSYPVTGIDWEDWFL